MKNRIFVLDRRLVLKGGLATLSGLISTQFVRAQSRADALLFTISDLHSPYARLPMLMETMRRIRFEAGVPAALLLNGDIFERGNIVCQRSSGAADWAFLTAVAAEMPVVVNLGNHETALLNDMATFVVLAEQAGIHVISNLIDRRTGQFFAPANIKLTLGGIDISLLGLAATNPLVYRAIVQESLTFLDTAQFVTDVFEDTSSHADVKIIMSHAGVMIDRSFIDTLPAKTIVQGAHDHLSLNLDVNGVRYFHGGSWGAELGVLSLTKAADEVQCVYQTMPIAPRGGDNKLAEFIIAQKEKHLESEERDVIAHIPRDMDLHHSILEATEAIRLAANADVAMINHTTFGASLAAGSMTRYDFDSFVRFGGVLKIAEISGVMLGRMMQRSNQFAATGLKGHTGDYVHVADIDLDQSKSYRLVVNAWTAANQEVYLGTTNVEFNDVPGLELKASIQHYLMTKFQ